METFAQSHNLIYVISLFCSSAIFLFLKYYWRAYVKPIFFWIHFFIVTWSATMYLNLVFQTPLAPYAYYADWIVSTPLIMLAIGLTAMYPLTKIDWPMLFALMMTQAMVVITGLLAQLSPTQPGMLTFFAVGNALMLLVVYFILGPLMHLALSNKKLYTKYKSLSGLLIILWFSYPVVWILGSPHYQILSPCTKSIMFIILPILCKPLFGLVDVYLLRTMKK